MGRAAGAALRVQHRRGRPLRAARGRDVRARDLNPHYFANPPAFTYVLHFLFALGYGGGDGVAPRARAASRRGVHARARRRGAARHAARCGCCTLTGARLFGRARRAARGGDRGGRVPARVLRAPGAQRRADARAADAVAAGDRRRAAQRPPRDYLLAGIGLGLACASKYTAGIVLVPLLAAAACQLPDGDAEGAAATRARRVCALAGRGRARGVPDREPLRGARLPELSRRTRAPVDAVGRSAGQARRAPRQGGLVYYLWSLTWGLGWAARAGGARRGARACGGASRRARAGCSCPAPLLFLAFMGLQGRYFGRWLLPIFPIAVPAGGASSRVRASPWTRSPRARLPARRPRGALARGCSSRPLLAQGLVYSVHSGLVLSRADTRNLTRAWMLAHIPAGAQIVVEPVAPDAWAREHAGHLDRGEPLPLDQVPRRCCSRDLRRRRAAKRQPGAEVGIEDYERTLAPALIGYYAAHGYCWVVERLDAVRARVRRPARGAARDRLLPRARPRRAKSSTAPRRTPRGQRAGRVRLRLELRLLPARLRAARAADDRLPAARRALRARALRGRLACAAQGYPGGRHAQLHRYRQGAPGARDRARAQRRAARSSPTRSSARWSRATARSSARAGTRQFGGAHAEVNAIEACGLADLSGATLYVSLEPCCHEGKTPPCTDAILQAGHQARGRRLRRSDREGLRARPRDPARRGRRGRGRRRRAGRAARGCSTRRSASTPASGARGCCSSRR